MSSTYSWGQDTNSSANSVQKDEHSWDREWSIVRRVACYSDDRVRARSEDTCASSSTEIHELTCAVI